MIDPIGAMLLGARIVTRESYRRCLLMRLLSGKFCDPISVYELPRWPA